MKQTSQLNLTQRTSMSTVQLMTVLQMNHIELYNYINDALQENPVLEDDGHPPVFQEFPRFSRQKDNEDHVDPINIFGIYEDRPSLYDSVCFQLEGLPGPEKECALSMAACLDENAILSQDSYEELCVRYGEPQAASALERLQALEPAGIAARSIPERLILQMHRAGISSPLAETILSQHLDHFVSHHYRKIASLTGATLKEVQQVCEQIQALDPFPFRAYSDDFQPHYIQPDLILDQQGTLSMNDSWFPKLQLSPCYTQLLSETQDREVSDYLTAKIRQASIFISSIAQRRNTILQCVDAIMEKQRPFFQSQGKAPLVPLTQNEIAKAVGVNVSTVSRAIKGKYLQCPFGCYALSTFFCSGVSGQEAQTVSSDHVKSRIRALIAQEPPEKPLSDQDLVTLLEKEGIHAARRTIAKYRGELGIPSVSARKK